MSTKTLAAQKMMTLDKTQSLDFDCILLKKCYPYLTMLTALLAFSTIASSAVAFVPLQGINAASNCPIISPAVASDTAFASKDRPCALLRRPRSKFVLHQTNQRKSDSEDDENDEEIFFDDFGDFVVGEASAGLTAGDSLTQQEALNERIREAQEKEVYRDTKLRKNWKSGDWSVRGFSLDPADALSEATVDNQMGMENDNDSILPVKTPSPIYISKIAPDVNSHGERIWVGRSNGSLVLVQLGTEYTTHFRSKLSGKFASSSEEDTPKSDDTSHDGKDDDAPSSFSAQVNSELVRETNSGNPLFEENEPFPTTVEDPFTILAQFSPVNEGHAVSTILPVPDEDCIFTACEGSGQILQWHISEEDIDSETPALKTPVPLSEGIHNEAIVALKMVWYQDAPLLLSVGSDGTLALWDISNSDLVYHCQVSMDIMGESEDSSTGSSAQLLINCADVNENYIYIGTSSGFVLGYDVGDLLNSASSGGSCPLPQGKFKAHEEGVTAIACGGPGSLSRVNSSGRPGNSETKTSSSVLLTGGAKGLVKQWCV